MFAASHKLSSQSFIFQGRGSVPVSGGMKICIMAWGGAVPPPQLLCPWLGQALGALPGGSGGADQPQVLIWAPSSLPRVSPVHSTAMWGWEQCGRHPGSLPAPAWAQQGWLLPQGPQNPPGAAAVTTSPGQSAPRLPGQHGDSRNEPCAAAGTGRGQRSAAPATAAPLVSQGLEHSSPPCSSCPARKLPAVMLFIPVSIQRGKSAPSF